MRNALAILLALSLTGCTAPSINPLKWVFGRKAMQVEKVQASEVKTEDKAATAAQIEVFKTTLALEQAKAEQPNFAPVVVADRTATNALALMQQRYPLTVEAQSQAREIVDGLLSAEASRRVSAEVKQALAEKSNARLSAELDEIRARLEVARKDAAAEAAQNLELANELRWQRIVAYSGAAASFIFGALCIAYRLNIGRLQTGAAEVIAAIGARHGNAAQDTARSVLDAAINVGDQQGIAKAFFKLTQK